MDINEGNPAELKVSLLSKGIDFDLDLFRDYKKDFYDNQFVYGKTSDHVTPEHRFPQVIRLGDGVISALLRREVSPWRLEIDEGEVSLYNRNRFVQTIDLPERPPYFDKTLKDGTRTEAIVAVAGEDTPGFFFYPDCYYFSEGVPCGFCSMKSTRRTVGKSMVSDFSEDNIAEATRLFQNTPWRDIPLISITMGTCKTDEETRKYVIHPIKVMYDALEPKIPVHILAHPPDDLDLIEEYKDAGVTSIAFNLEAFDRQAFERMCPGKHRFYGYDKWMEAVKQARDVFGNYKAFCGLVWGLEPAESAIDGNEYFLDNRIGIASNIFHADPRSILRNYPHPSEDFILKIANAQARQYHDHPEAKTIFPVSMRSTVDWESYRGDFE